MTTKIILGSYYYFFLQEIFINEDDRNKTKCSDAICGLKIKLTIYIFFVFFPRSLTSCVIKLTVLENYILETPLTMRYISAPAIEKMFSVIGSRSMTYDVLSILKALNQFHPRNCCPVVLFYNLGSERAELVCFSCGVSCVFFLCFFFQVVFVLFQKSVETDTHKRKRENKNFSLQNDIRII